MFTPDNTASKTRLHAQRHTSRQEIQAADAFTPARVARRWLRQASWATGMPSSRGYEDTKTIFLQARHINDFCDLPPFLSQLVSPDKNIGRPETISPSWVVGFGEAKSVGYERSISVNTSQH